MEKESLGRNSTTFLSQVSIMVAWAGNYMRGGGAGGRRERTGSEGFELCHCVIMVPVWTLFRIAALRLRPNSPSFSSCRAKSSSRQPSLLFSFLQKKKKKASRTIAYSISPTAWLPHDIFSLFSLSSHNFPTNFNNTNLVLFDQHWPTEAYKNTSFATGTLMKVYNGFTTVNINCINGILAQ